MNKKYLKINFEKENAAFMMYVAVKRNHLNIRTNATLHEQRESELTGYVVIVLDKSNEL